MSPPFSLHSRGSRRCLRLGLAWAAMVGAAVASADAAVTSMPLAPPSSGPAEAPVLVVLSPAESGVDVPNVFDDPRMWGDRFREFTLGAVETGVALGDFDGDGLLDIFAVSRNGPSSLYRQVAPFRFVDVAAAAGVTCYDPDGPVSHVTGATAIDINQDGAMDLYVCRIGEPNLLFVNRGDGTFEERAQAYGLDVNDASVHALFADYDGDGYLDCYLVTNILDFASSPHGRRDYLFRNDGDGTFVDVTQEAGIWGLSQGHTAIWFDADGNGWPDLYVANDFETPDRFYLNQGDGTFVDVIDQRLPHVTYFSMGADAGDLNNDGHMDFLVSDMRDRTHAEYIAGMEEIGRGLWEMERVAELIPQYAWNALYLHSGTDRYLEAAHLAGMEATGWTFGTRLADLDTDGYLDALFTTGMVRNFIDADIIDRQNRAPTLAARARIWKDAAPRAETPVVYRSVGGADAGLAFDDVTAAWGLDRPGIAFGLALGDLDNDGDLDLVYANYGEPPTVVRNDHVGAHRISVRLAGRPPNRDGIGAELRLESTSGTQLRQIFTERGIVASEAPVAHFGLGTDDMVRRLTIRWPQGQVQILEDLPADRAYVIEEPPRSATGHPPAQGAAPATAETLLVEGAAERGLTHVSSLAPFDEFTRQRLLPRRLHGLGPALAMADVDGDGRADVFVSGSAGQAGQLFLQQPDGVFAPAEEQPWEEAAEADDRAAAFVDVDGDGHQDLIVVGGGVVHPAGDARLDDRLYLNDGRGNFTMAPASALPTQGVSGGCIAFADVDGDGRPDLFIGGRVVPGRYPATPRSFLLRNAGDGSFVDVTEDWAPGLAQAGMVTAADFADIDGDERLDLVLALEWGPVMLWRNTGNGLVDRSAEAGLAAVTGWWSALALADVDGDGRPDIVAGNNGLNTKYRASPDEPAVLLAGVFDDSERERIVEAHYVDGRLMPMRGRSKLAYAFPWLPAKFPTYRAFAEASINEIFDPERLARVRRLEANELASGVFLNRPTEEGGVGFEFRPLPRLAQLAPVNAWVAHDLDGDGAVDLVGVGNHFGPEPTTGRFDGGLGIVLRGDGRGGFRAMLPGESGLVVPGDARAAATLPLADGERLGVLVARRDGPLLLFSNR